METLHITDVVLDPSPEELDIPNLPFTTFLAFEDMHDSQIMDQIIHLIDLYQISFIRCTFGHIADTFRHFGDADAGGAPVLVKIDQDIGPLLSVWDADDLHIQQCPGFDDTILDAMGSEENGTFACATYVRSLTIADCSNFSISALRRFVESRLHLPPHNDDEWNPSATRVQHLHLFNNLPPISEADRERMMDGCLSLYRSTRQTTPHLLGRIGATSSFRGSTRQQRTLSRRPKRRIN
jgi:hypothetical protein